MSQGPYLLEHPKGRGMDPSHNNQIPRTEGQGMLFSRCGYTQGFNTLQEKKLQKTVLAHYPDSLQCDCALWTHEAVRQLLKRESSIAMQYGPWQHSLPDEIHTANTGYRVHMNELPRR